MTNDKKLIIAVLVIGVIVMFSIFLVRFGPNYFDLTSEVETIDSVHVDFYLKIILDSQQLDLDAKAHPELLKINPNIFLDEDNRIHRIATDANLQMLLQSIGMEFIDNCLVIRSEFNDIFDDQLRQTQYCDTGKTKLRMYDFDSLKDFDIPSYIPNINENLILIYDDIDDETRDFTTFHHKELLAANISAQENTDEAIILEQLTSSGDVNVKLEWPEIYPHEMSVFTVSFHDPITDELISTNTRFDFTIVVTQNDHIIEEYYEESTQGTFQYQILFPEDSKGYAEVLLTLNFIRTFEEVLKLDEEISFSVNVISEYED